VQLFQQGWLRDVAMMILIQDKGSQEQPKMATGNDACRQRRYYRLAVRQLQALTQISRVLAFDYQFLNVVLFIAVRHRSRWRIGMVDDNHRGRASRVLLRALVGTRPFLTFRRWRLGGRFFK